MTQMVYSSIRQTLHAVGGMWCLLGLMTLSAYAATPWSDMAARDLGAIKRTLEEDHPGSVDSENPQFKAWLLEGYRKALSEAKDQPSFSGYKNALRRYVTGFQDGHLGLHLMVDSTEVKTPGFVAGFDGTSFVIARDFNKGAGASPPLVGDTVVSCDGLPADSLFASRVLAFSGVVGLAAWKYRRAPWLFVDDQDQPASRPETCVFRRNGKEKTVKLTWRSMARSAWNDHAHATIGDSARKPAMRQLQDGGYWVSLPSFWPEGADETLLKAVVKEVEEKAALLRRSKFVVFDVRGNQGGASLWGEAISDAFWGREFLNRYVDRKEIIDHRASARNIAHYRNIVLDLEQRFGRDSADVGYFKKVLAGMDSASKKNEPYFRLSEAGVAPRSGATMANPVQAPVFFLTDSHCFSACLDFADILLSLPGVTHVGRPTDADTAYIEVRGELLPSGLARLVVPTKVYRGRKRKNNEPYNPTHAWNGNIADDLALENWLRTLPPLRPSGQ